MIFIYFAFSSPLKFSWHSSFSLAIEPRALFIAVTFLLLNIRDLKISLRKKNVILGEHNKNKTLGNHLNVQNQSLEVFYKKNCSKKVCNIHREKPELESLYKKVVPTQVFSCEYCETFKNTYFEEHLRTTAFECRLKQQRRARFAR